MMEGRSGRARIFSPDGRNYVELGLKSVVEVASDGVTKLNRGTPDFENFDFQWTGPRHEILGGKNASRYDLKATLAVAGGGASSGYVNLSLATHVWREQVTVPYGNTSITVPQYSLKWTVEMGAWPWKQASSQLQLRVTAHAKMRGDDNLRDQPPQLNTNSNHNNNNNNAAAPPPPPNGVPLRKRDCDVGRNAVMELPMVAILDGVMTNITASYEGRNVVFTFPHYQTSLLYDPVLQATDASDGNTSGAMDKSASSMFVISVLAMLVAILYM
jgi:hypothetical protein